MVELVLLFPPIDDHEVAAAAVVDADEPDAVARRCDGWRREGARGGRLGGFDQRRPRGLSSIRDSVLLDPPVAAPPRPARRDRARGVRLDHLDHALRTLPRTELTATLARLVGRFATR